MGTKNNPGKYDCLAAAEPDEPTFTLLGRDSTASWVILFWRGLKLKMRQQGKSGISDEKLEEASTCAAEMQKWTKDHGKSAGACVPAVIALLASYDMFGVAPKDLALAHLQSAAKLLKPSEIEKLVEMQRAKEEGPETDLVCSMAYAAAEVFHMKGQT